MSPFDLPPNNNSTNWLIFGGIMLAVFVPVILIFLWIIFFRKRSARKRQKHRKHRHHHQNPTLAETGGLPPLRQPDEPPRGT
jgi:heme/copper-type cytochrome/quinol oxidase subunit 2